MSRVGKVPVKIQQGVKVEIKDGLIRVEGPKGKLSHRLAAGISAKVENNAVLVKPLDSKSTRGRQLYGVTRTLINNMVHGVTTGFSRELEIVGVGYRAAVKGKTLSLTVGYSHPIDFALPEGITAKVDNNTLVTVTGADKHLVSLVASKIRGFKEPEPYQGKGIKYVGERIIRKQGKAAGAK